MFVSFKLPIELISIQSLEHERYANTYWSKKVIGAWFLLISMVFSSSLMNTKIGTVRT